MFIILIIDFSVIGPVHCAISKLAKFGYLCPILIRVSSVICILNKSISCICVCGILISHSKLCIVRLSQSAIVILFSLVQCFISVLIVSSVNRHIPINTDVYECICMACMCEN